MHEEGERMAVIGHKDDRAGERLHFPFVEGTGEVTVGELIYVETDRHRNLFHTQQGVYSIYRKLDEIEQQFEGLGFLRVHRSFLVNMRYVDRISSYICYLKTGEQISVPKPRYPYVKEQFSAFLQNRPDAG